MAAASRSRVGNFVSISFYLHSPERWVLLHAVNVQQGPPSFVALLKEVLL
jgi:hypothetical protein